MRRLYEAQNCRGILEIARAVKGRDLSTMEEAYREGDGRRYFFNASKHLSGAQCRLAIIERVRQSLSCVAPE